MAESLLRRSGWGTKGPKAAQAQEESSANNFFWGLSWTLESTQFIDFKRIPPLSISLSSFSGPIASSQGQNCICSANCGVIGCLNGA